MKRPTLLTMMLVPTLLTITVGFAGFGAYVERIESRSRLADIDDELVRAEAGGAAGQRPTNTPVPGPVGAPDDSAPTSSVAVDRPVELIVAPDGAILQTTGADNPFTSEELAVLATQNGQVTAANGEFRALVSPLADGTRSVTALPLDGFNAAVNDFRRALLAGGIVVIMLEALVIWLVAKVVSRPVVRMTGTATRVADGQLDTAVGPPSGSRETAQLAVDLERMLIRLRATLETSESSATDARTARDQMERFLADVSHEFRTPLTALHGYSDLYAKGMLDDEAVERAMQRMGSESARLNSLVNDMMQLARKGSADSEPEVFDLADIIRDVVEDLRSAHPGRAIGSRIPSGIDPRIVGIPGQIHQALLNLGANACAYSNDHVHIALAADGTHLELSVVDHGPGIDEADRERILQPFVRLDASRTRNGAGGAGLGLALTNQIAASHQGTIRVDETPGGGATLTLRLPRAALTIDDPLSAQ
jgi:two-component system OmpR family sensor kinase